jgi:hypothetical protein
MMLAFFTDVQKAAAVVLLTILPRRDHHVQLTMEHHQYR